MLVFKTAAAKDRADVAALATLLNVPIPDAWREPSASAALDPVRHVSLESERE